MHARAEIEILAPVQLVWDVMIDVAAYPQWNPFVVRIEATPPIVPGSAMRLEVRWSHGGVTISPERVMSADPPAERDGIVRASLVYRFDGALHAAWLVRGSRLQELESAPGSAVTRYRTSETFSGALARFVPLADVQDGFERHAAALKQRAESLYARAASAV